MIAANVPTIEGYNDANQDPEFLFEQSKNIGNFWSNEKLWG